MTTKAPYRTRQQRELLQYLRATPGMHHTAAEIHEHFNGGERPIGMATIYRQLERFVDEGIVRKYVLETGDGACYEYEQEADECLSHFHCKCEKCGRLIHLECADLEEIRTHLLRHHGFDWHAGKTVFYGLCDACRRE